MVCTWVFVTIPEVLDCCVRSSVFDPIFSLKLMPAKMDELTYLTADSPQDVGGSISTCKFVTKSRINLKQQNWSPNLCCPLFLVADLQSLRSIIISFIIIYSYHTWEETPVCTLDLIASMAEWLRAWDTLAMMKLWRREVVSLIPDRGTIVGWVFSPTRQLVRFSHLNMPSFQNSEFIWNVVLVGKQ